jgi:hypothetical protein
MAKAGQSGLEAIGATLSRAARKGPPPVHLWNPPFCGDIDMKIAADGTWFYQKTPIGRPALVRLFASVLKREEGRYFLVTPVEKVGIIVEDVPFLAVELAIKGDLGRQTLSFRTNVDDWVAAGPEHTLRFEEEAGTGGLKPYLHVRHELWAKVTARRCSALPPAVSSSPWLRRAPCGNLPDDGCRRHPGPERERIF